MKVVHINNSDVNGGPAFAANRLHTALRKYGVDSAMLVQDAQSGAEHIVQAAGTIEKGKAFAQKHQ